MPVTVEIADTKSIHIRLLQFKPAWALHCFLRFKDLPYLSENAGTRESLGLRLPILIDGNYAFAERLAIEHLSKDRQTRNVNCEHSSDVHDEIPDQFSAADKIMSDHIEISLIEVYEQLESQIEATLKNGLLGLSVAAKVIGKFKSWANATAISSETNEERYSECDSEALLLRLERMYAEIDSILNKNKGFLISISVTAPTLVTASANVILGGQKTVSRHRGVAEAVLFGHLVEALSNPTVSPIIKKYDHLTVFTRNILEEYFLIPMRSPKVSLRLSFWEDATNSILENAIFVASSSSTLKDSLQMPVCPPSPSGFADVNPLRVTITDRSYTSPRRQNSSKTPDSAYTSRTGTKSGIVTPPRRSTSPKSPPRTHFNFDSLGTEKSSEQIRVLRTLGPGTILDLPPGLCGRYLVVPRFFSKMFPDLTESSGHVRLTRQNDIDSFFRSDEVTVAASDMNSAVKEDIFSEGFSTENLDKLDSPAADLAATHSDPCNKDVEMSLLGAIFMTVVGGIFIVNIVTGNS